MKWFKHYVDAHNGKTLKGIFRKFGLEGEARYWRLVSLLSSKYVGEAQEFEFDLETIRETFRHRSATDSRSFLDQLATLSGMVVHYSENSCRIKYDKITEIKDNHVSNLQATYKQLAPRIDIDKEKEEDKELDIASAPEISKKNLPEKKSKAKRKTLLESSPLAALFPATDEIQVWLRTGTEAAQRELLEKFSHHVLAEEVKRAFLWQLEKQPRQAGTFLLTWMGNAKTKGFGLKINPHTSESNPTGNKYLAEYKEKYGDEEKGA